MEDVKNICAGVILSGGLSSRFNGKNKALIEIGGRSILSRIYEVFERFFDEILIVSNDPLLYTDYDAAIVTDFYPVRSSLTGIHAGVQSALRPFSFIVACDVPLLQEKTVETILGRISDPFDVIIPETEAGLEPLCAVYNKSCLSSITHRIEQKRFKIIDMFRKMRVRKVSEKMLRQSDPSLLSFINVNTPGDLERVNALVARLPEPHEEMSNGY